MTLRKDYQISTSLTEQQLTRLDRRREELAVKARSGFVVAAIDFFCGQSDEKILYWLEKVHEDMERGISEVSTEKP